MLRMYLLCVWNLLCDVHREKRNNPLRVKKACDKKKAGERERERLEQREKEERKVRERKSEQ